MWFISAYDQIPKWLMIDNGLIPYLHDFSSSAFPFPKKNVCIPDNNHDECSKITFEQVAVIINLLVILYSYKCYFYELKFMTLQ